MIQPFLRLENSPVEQGYNTSGGTPFDDKAEPWTHDLTFGDLQNTQVTLGGASYFKLLLDFNEPGGSKSLISLDQLQFYTSKVGSQTTGNVGSLGTLRYTFRSGDSVILDASRNHGSGSGDMYAYIPTSDFAGTKTSDFVYLYAHFGTTDNSQAGFEEWALVSAAPHSRDKRAVSYYRFFCAGLRHAIFAATSRAAVGRHRVFTSSYCGVWRRRQ